MSLPDPAEIARALAEWPKDALRRHADQWAHTAEVCTRLHTGCDCNRIYRRLSAAARQHLLESQQ